MQRSSGARIASQTLRCLVRALSNAFLRRSPGVAAILGSILNAINQSEAWVGDAPVAWTKLASTHCVPFE